MPPAVEAQSPDHWTAKEVPQISFKHIPLRSHKSLFTELLEEVSVYLSNQFSLLHLCSSASFAGKEFGSASSLPCNRHLDLQAMSVLRSRLNSGPWLTQHMLIAKGPRPFLRPSIHKHHRSRELRLPVPPPSPLVVQAPQNGHSVGTYFSTL